ncbi:MAG: hypothetical protein JSV25_12440 [Spirochaetota bacterium]|nr:MAG: hypothetical protein JSV25_12440 [Spirochaetota bacterium]
MPFSKIILSSILLSVLFLFSESMGDGDTSLYYRDYDSLYDFKNKMLQLDIECHSGTPLILEFVITKGKDIGIKRIDFDFESDGVIDLTLEKIHGEVIFRGVPYSKKGTYKASLYFETVYGTFMREYIISYTDFIWGRDNFSFANDGKFENIIEFVSDTVVEWAEDRFGALNQEQKIMVLYLMYGIYKGSIGRCYGFSSGESYYLSKPERLPAPYATTYEIDEMDRRIIQGMDWRQNDIVFSTVISGAIDLYGEQDSSSLREVLERIKSTIASGNSIIIPYISQKMHHSMAAYGHFENLFRDSVTLLVANNWEREQNSNVYSEDAENIVIQFSRNSHRITWYDLTKRRHRYPEKIFALTYDENYRLAPDDFLYLIEKTKRDIVENDRFILIIEQVEHAYMVNDEGKKKGYSKPKRLNEFEEVSYRKIDYNYIFEIPKEGNYSLVLKKKRFNKERKVYYRVNIFGLFPRDGKLESFVMRDVDLQGEVEKVFTVDGQAGNIVEAEEQSNTQ